MDKKLLIIGVVLLVASLVSFGFIPQLSPISSVSPLKIVLNPMKNAYAPFQVNGTVPFLIVYNATLPIDFYVANSSAFTVMRNYVIDNKSLVALSSEMKGKGIFYINENATSGSFPYNYSVSEEKPLFQSNASVVGRGNYTAIIENQNANSVNVTLVLIYGKNISLASVIIPSTIAVLLFFISIAIIIYSFFRKPKIKDTQNDIKLKSKEIDEEAEKIYNEIEKKSRVKVKHGERRRKIK